MLNSSSVMNCSARSIVWVSAALPLVAAQAATVAAEATAQLTPKLGRARSHTQRSLGHPDAGAVSLAMIARLVGDLLRQRG